MTTTKRIFLTLAAIFFLCMHWSGWYETSLFAFTRAIVEEGRAEITSFARETGDWVRIGDDYYMPQAPGISLLAVPIHAFSVLAFSVERPPENKNISMMGDYEREFVLPTHLSLAERFSMVISTFLLSGFLTIATAYLLFLFSKEFIKDKRIQYLVPIGYALGTLAFSQALVLKGHATATFFVFASFFIGYYTIKKSYFSERWGGILAGILGGIAFLVDYFALVVVAGIGLWLLLSRSPKVFLLYVTAFAAVAALILIYNIAVFGTPVFISYAAALPEAKLGEMKMAAESFFGSVVHGYFNLDFLWFRVANIVRLLFMPERGMFFYFPFLLLTIPGMFFLFRQRLALGIMISIIFLSLLWLMPLIPWWGGSSFGARHLTIVMPFLMIPIMFALKKVHISILVFLIAVSMFINILGLQPPAGLSQELDSMDSEEYYTVVTSLTVIKNPLADYYWPRFKEYGINMPLFNSALAGKPFDIRSNVLLDEREFRVVSTPLGSLFVSRSIMPFLIIIFFLSFIWFSYLRNTFWKYSLIVGIIVLAASSFHLE